MMDALSQTLLIDRQTVSQLMRPADYLEAVTAAFLAGEQGMAHSPPPLHIVACGGGHHAKGAFLGTGRKVVAVKLNGNFPDNPARRGLPTIQGAIMLCDGENGRLLAVLDSIEITLRRTAAASALAAQHLARPNAATVAIIGCGAQAHAQIEAMAEVLPLRRVVAWDSDPIRAEALLETQAGLSTLDWMVAPSLDDAASRGEVIVTCTTSQVAYLGSGHVRPGTFIAAVGADNPAKSEIAPELMARSAVIVDSLDQCLQMGDLHHAVSAGEMTADDVRASLGALASGKALGRKHPDEVCIFDSTGTALQDVASALLAYERARASGLGIPFAFA